MNNKGITLYENTVKTRIEKLLKPDLEESERELFFASGSVERLPNQTTASSKARINILDI